MRYKFRSFSEFRYYNYYMNRCSAEKWLPLEYVMPGNTAYVSDLCQAAVEMQIQSVTVKEWSF